MTARRDQQKCILAVASVLFAPGTTLKASPIIGPGDRIVFLGDSITAAGHFISYVEAHLRLQIKGDPVEGINLGLPSEGCTGLSEPDHPFPRPNVHERLSRVLETTKPDVVVACYGMNDGIYFPFSKGRFMQYQQGIRQVSRVIKRSDVRLILLTPPAFDPLPLKLAGKLLPAGAEKYAWFAIYEGYDDVIRKYADWLASQRRLADLVVDVHTPVVSYIADKRKENPMFVMSPDGVHVNLEGHRVIARSVVEGLGLEWDPTPDAKLFARLESRRALMHAAWLSYVRHKRPGIQPGLPIGEARSSAAELEKTISQLVEQSRGAEDVNQSRLP